MYRYDEFDHAFVHRVQEAHGEKDQIGRDREFATLDRLHLLVEAHAFQLLDLAVAENPVRAGLVLKSSDWPYQGELKVLEWHDRR